MIRFSSRAIDAVVLISDIVSPQHRGHPVSRHWPKLTSRVTLHVWHSRVLSGGSSWTPCDAQTVQLNGGPPQLWQKGLT